jgi:dTDP-glucose 4,6-dehydratase
VPRFHIHLQVYGDLPLDGGERFSESSPYRPRTPTTHQSLGGYGGAPSRVPACRSPSQSAQQLRAYQFPESHPALRRAPDRRPDDLYRSSRSREWLHVLDHCRAIDLILKQGQVGETYNIGSGLEVDVETIAGLLLAQFGLDETWKSYVPDRPGHDRRYLLDSSRIRRELGWQPQIDFEQGFAATVDWYRQNEAWWRPLLKRLQIDEGTWR